MSDYRQRLSSRDVSTIDAVIGYLKEQADLTVSGEPQTHSYYLVKTGLSQAVEILTTLRAELEDVHR